jgi:uncharacterized protein (TIGR02145 family)
MKRTFYLMFVLVFAIVTNVFGQKQTIELTFTAQYQTQYVMLDSIYIENLTQGGDTTLYAPDTVLVLDYVTGLSANTALNSGFRVSQNRPNPFAEQTIISIFLPEADHLQVSVINLLGQKVAFFEHSLDAGNHSFVFYPGDDKYYILTATANGLRKTIKMVSMNNHLTKQVLLRYQGLKEDQVGYKNIQDINDFSYSLGDSLIFIGYGNTPELINGSDVICISPNNSQEYSFQILEGLPCVGTPFVIYEGQMYNTAQIGSHCLFKENLNVGIMVNSNINQTNNGLNEKYCYANNEEECAIYGGLYQWNEMMQYSPTPGVQGICPTNWHIPTYEDWCTFTDFIDPTVNCDPYPFWEGTDAGTKMKNTTGWSSTGNGTNESGFTALPGGHLFLEGLPIGFGGLNYRGSFWTASEYGTGAVYLMLHKNNADIRYDVDLKSSGFSVRCFKD